MEAGRRGERALAELPVSPSSLMAHQSLVVVQGGIAWHGKLSMFSYALETVGSGESEGRGDSIMRSDLEISPATYADIAS